MTEFFHVSRTLTHKKSSKCLGCESTQKLPVALALRAFLNGQPGGYAWKL